MIEKVKRIAATAASVIVAGGIAFLLYRVGPRDVLITAASIGFGIASLLLVIFMVLGAGAIRKIKCSDEQDISMDCIDEERVTESRKAGNDYQRARDEMLRLMKKGDRYFGGLYSTIVIGMLSAFVLNLYGVMAEGVSVIYVCFSYAINGPACTAANKETEGTAERGRIIPICISL